MKEKCVFLTKYTVFEWNLKLILYAYTFRRNLYLNKIHKNSFLFNMTLQLEMQNMCNHKNF